MTISISLKVSENVAMTMYKKYATALNSACNIYAPEELGIMIYRYMDAGVPYPKFGRVTCGQGFQSWNTALSSLNFAVTNMCDTDHEDSSQFVDGLDPAMASMICLDKYSYNVPAWSFSNCRLTARVNLIRAGPPLCQCRRRVMRRGGFRNAWPCQPVSAWRCGSVLMRLWREAWEGGFFF